MPATRRLPALRAAIARAEAHLADAGYWRTMVQQQSNGRWGVVDIATGRVLSRNRPTAMAAARRVVAK